MKALEDIKKVFLYLLDEDKDVRDKLKEILNDAGDAREDEPAATMPITKAGRKKPDVSVAELAEAKTKLNEALRQKEEAESLYRELRQELQNQQEAYKQKFNEWETERVKLQTAQKTAQGEASQWEQKFTQKETDLQTALAEKEKLQTKQEQTKNDLKKAQDKIADQEATLKARFPRGWELFKQYSRLGAATREELTRVFVNEEDFTSFICCGAQSDALEKIWDIMENCWEKKEANDLRILQTILAYCMELANLSRREKIFAMLEAKPGDKYDRRIHLLEPSSKKQGAIHQVCVQGFYNANTGKVIKQALVNLE